MHGSHGRARIYPLLAIECIERFVWFSWYQTLSLREADSGPILLLTYTLPIALAPLASRIGTGVALALALVGYALSFFASSFVPGPWLIVVSSGLYRASFGPTLKERATERDFARLFFAVNLGVAVGSFAYSPVIRRVGLAGVDMACGGLLLVAAALAVPLFRTRSEPDNRSRDASWSSLAVFCAYLLPLFTAYWLFVDHYRKASIPLFVGAGLPAGTLMGALCLWVLFWSAVCSHRAMAGVLQRGPMLLFLGGLLYAVFFVVLGVTYQAGTVTPWVLLAECGLFTLAESLCGAVMQRLLMEHAPKASIGSAAFFCMMGIAAWLASRLVGILPAVNHGGLLFWAAAIVMLSPALMLGTSRRFSHV